MTKNRTCEHSHCDKVLNPRQKRFCSHECKNKTLAPGKNGGRRSLYKEKYAEYDVWEYLRKCELNTTQRLVERKTITVGQPVMPSIAGYLNFLWRKHGVIIHKNTLRNWSKHYPQFDHRMEIIKTVQCEYLISGGLNGDCNAGMTTFLLQANHGYRPKYEQKRTSAIAIVKEVYEMADKIDQSLASTTPLARYSTNTTRTQTLIS